MISSEFAHIWFLLESCCYIIIWNKCQFRAKCCFLCFLIFIFKWRCLRKLLQAWVRLLPKGKDEKYNSREVERKFEQATFSRSFCWQGSCPTFHLDQKSFRKASSKLRKTKNHNHAEAFACGSFFIRKQFQLFLEVRLRKMRKLFPMFLLKINIWKNLAKRISVDFENGK